MKRCEWIEKVRHIISPLTFRSITCPPKADDVFFGVDTGAGAGDGFAGAGAGGDLMIESFGHTRL